MSDSKEYQDLYLPELCVIPSKVREDKNLQAEAKIFYGELAVLSNKYGYCWATDEALAKMKEVSESTIERWLKSLSDGGHILRETHNRSYRDEKERLLWKRDRKIYVGVGVLKKVSDTPKSEGINDTPKSEGINDTPKSEGINNKPLNIKLEKEEGAFSLFPSSPNFEEEKEVFVKKRMCNQNFQKIEVSDSERYLLAGRSLELTDMEWNDVCLAFLQRAKKQDINPIGAYFTVLIQKKAKPSIDKEKAKEEVVKANKELVVKAFGEDGGKCVINGIEIYVEVLNSSVEVHYGSVSHSFKYEIIGFLPLLKKCLEKCNVLARVKL